MMVISGGKAATKRRGETVVETVFRKGNEN